MYLGKTIRIKLVTRRPMELHKMTKRELSVYKVIMEKKVHELILC